MRSGLKKIYSGVSPEFLLLAGWLVLSAAMGMRAIRDLDIPLINGLFVLVGLAAYFLPTRLCDGEKGETLRRKLLWLTVLAGLAILGGETTRLLLPDGRM